MIKIFFTFLLFSIAAMPSDFDEFDIFPSTSEKHEKPFLVFNGFWEIEQGQRLTTDGAHGRNGEESSSVMGIRRLRLQTNKNVGKANFYGKLDFVNTDHGANSIDTREMRVNYRLTQNTDVSIGRQVSTWGVADMLFINDLFPKNWVASFQGRDMEMLKDPSNSVRVLNYWGDYSFDVVYQPEFTSDLTPTGCRFSVFDPNSNSIIANKRSCDVIDSTHRDKDKAHPELAMRLKKKIGLHEVAFYSYDGYFKSPRSIKSEGGVFYPEHSELKVYGASYEGQVGAGILTFETGYYDSVEDRKGDDYLIENSSLKYLLGYRQDLTSSFSYGTQIYQEKIQNYKDYEDSFFAMNPVGYKYRKQETQSTFTLRLTYKTQQETLWFSLFTYIRPQDEDSFTKLEASKKINDNFKIVAGVNSFTGTDNYSGREFGMLRDDDNIFMRMNYIF